MIKKYPKQFKKVSDYLKEKFGIDVLLGQITAFMGHKNKKIFIHHNHNLEKNGLYSLLQEVGHALQTDKDNYFKTIDEDKEPKKFIRIAIDKNLEIIEGDICKSKIIWMVPVWSCPK